MAPIGRWLQQPDEREHIGRVWQATGSTRPGRCDDDAERAAAGLAPRTSLEAEVAWIRDALADPWATREAARLLSEEVGHINDTLQRASDAAGQAAKSFVPFQAGRKASMRARGAFDAARTEGVLIHDALINVVETGRLPITADPLEGALNRFAGLIRTAAAEATYHRSRSIFDVALKRDVRDEVMDARTVAGQLGMSAAYVDASVQARHDAIAAGTATAWPVPASRSGQPTSSASTSDGLAFIGSVAGDLRKRLDHCAKIADDIGLDFFLSCHSNRRFKEALPLLKECFVAAGFASLALREVIQAAAAASLAKDLEAALRHLDHAAEQATVAQEWGAAHDELLNRVAPIVGDAGRELQVAAPASSAALIDTIDELIVAAAESLYREAAWAVLSAAVSAASDDVTRAAST